MAHSSALRAKSVTFLFLVSPAPRTANLYLPNERINAHVEGSIVLMSLVLKRRACFPTQNHTRSCEGWQSSHPRMYFKGHKSPAQPTAGRWQLGRAPTCCPLTKRLPVPGLRGSGCCHGNCSRRGAGEGLTGTGNFQSLTSEYVCAGGGGVQNARRACPRWVIKVCCKNE